MAKSIDKIEREIRDLTDVEKLRLVDTILTESDKPDPEIGKVWAEEARKRWAAYVTFVKDVFLDGNVTVVRLDPDEMPEVVRVIGQFQLDFDDAYHYAVAEKYELTIVSFDRDFDRTRIGRKAPADI